MKKLIAVLLGSGIIAAAVVINRDFLSVPTHAEGNRPIKNFKNNPAGRISFLTCSFSNIFPPSNAGNGRLTS